MPSWTAVGYGIILSAVVAVVAVRLLLRERRPSVLLGRARRRVSAPLLWDLILRHTGGRLLRRRAGLRSSRSASRTRAQASSRPRSPRSCSDSARSEPATGRTARAHVRPSAASQRFSSTSISTERGKRRHPLHDPPMRVRPRVAVQSHPVSSLDLVASTPPASKEDRMEQPSRDLELETVAAQCSGLACETGAGGSGAPPGPSTKVSGETAACWPTPGRLQSHTPPGNAACSRANCAGEKTTGA